MSSYLAVVATVHDGVGLSAVVAREDLGELA